MTHEIQLPGEAATAFPIGRRAMHPMFAEDAAFRRDLRLLARRLRAARRRTIPSFRYEAAQMQMLVRHERRRRGLGDPAVSGLYRPLIEHVCRTSTRRWQ